MATLEDIRSSIMSQAYGQVPSDDGRLRKRFVEHVIRSVRSELIKDFARRNVGVPQGFYQRICCLDVKCDNVVCHGHRVPIDTEHVDIPILEDIPGNPSYFGTADGKTPFRRTGLNMLPFFTGGSFRRREGAFAISGDKAFIRMPSRSMAGSLCLHGILSDPMEKACVALSERDPYPVPQNMIHKLELIALRQILSTLPIRHDDVNDGVDDSNKQSQPRVSIPNE